MNWAMGISLRMNKMISRYRIERAPADLTVQLRPLLGSWPNIVATQVRLGAASVKRSAQLNAAALLSTVIAMTNGWAQQEPASLEPLPTDPKKRIYYGEYYDPQEYAKCWEKWIKTGDPRGIFCEKYKERFEPLDLKRRETFGEFYDPKKYHECRARVEARDTQCEYLRLRRIESPEYWPYQNTPEPKFPAPPNPPVYKRGMNAKQYFEALCKAEAGEFVYRTVENVESIYQVRPRRSASTAAIRDRYVLEDPYGYTDAEARTPATIFLGPKKYRYFEVPARRIGRDSNDVVIRFFGYDDRDPKSLRREFDSRSKSRYGYTWREIRRPQDRENAIVGGELIALDLQTNEVLGIRRGFIISGNVRNVKTGIQWEIGAVCPRLTDRPGWPKGLDFAYWFVSKVLKPATSNRGRGDAAERK